MQRTTIKDLLEAGVHFGHQTKRWNPKMKPYIYGTRSGITIFDLTRTMRQLAEACVFLRDTTAEGGDVLFVGAKRQAQEIVREVAERLGMHFMCDRWLGGTLTNNRVVQSRIAHMKKLQLMETDGSADGLTKKEISGLNRVREKLERTLGGIADMPKLPQALVVIDVGREHIAVCEARKLGIPVVGLVDSNCDPKLIDFVIPGNDDALRSIKVVVETLAAAIQEGISLRARGAEETTPATPAPAEEEITAPADVADEGASTTEEAPETTPVAEEEPAEAPDAPEVAVIPDAPAEETEIGKVAE